MEFVGNVATAEGIEMQADLKSAILEWPAPTTIRHFQQFIELANYCGIMGAVAQYAREKGKGVALESIRRA